MRRILAFLLLGAAAALAAGLLGTSGQAWQLPFAAIGAYLSLVCGAAGVTRMFVPFLED